MISGNHLNYSESIPANIMSSCLSADRVKCEPPMSKSVNAFGDT